MSTSIRTRLLTTLLPIVAVAIIAALLIATSTARRALEHEARRNLTQAAVRMTDALGQLIADAKADTVTTARLDLAAQALDSDDPKNFNWYADELVRGKNKYAAIAVIDSRGSVIGTSSVKPLAGSLALEPYFARVGEMANGQVATIARAESKAIDAVIGFAAPVFDISDERIGTVLVFCAPSYFRDRVGGEGLFALEDGSGTVFDPRQEGVAYVTEAAQIPSIGWRVTALQTEASLRAPINSMTALILGAGAIALVIATVVTSLLTGRAVAREAALEAKLAERTTSLVDILDAMDQALFTVGRDGAIGSEHSAVAVRMFATTAIAGARAVDFFQFAEAYNDGDARMHNWLTSIIGTDDLQWTLASEDPTKLIRYRKQDGSEAFLELSYRPIFKDGLVDRVMIAVTDVTRLRDLEHEIRVRDEENRLTVERITEVVSVDPQLFSTFLAEARDLTDHALTNLTDIDALFRDMHTLKGNARIFRLTTIQNAAHAIEHTLDLIRNGGTHYEQLAAEVTAFGELIASFEHLSRRVIGAQQVASEASTVQVREAKILALRRAFKALPASPETRALGAAIAQLGTIPFGATLARYRREVTDIARTLNKPLSEPHGDWRRRRDR